MAYCLEQLIQRAQSTLSGEDGLWVHTGAKAYRKVGADDQVLE